MKHKSIKTKIVKLNIELILFVVFFTSCVLIISVFLQINNSRISVLEAQSYEDQVLIMQNLDNAKDNNVVDYLVKMSPYFINNISSEPMRVQIISNTGEIIADSKDDNIKMSDDIQSALDVSKSYTFFRDKLNLNLSFSSPIYHDGTTIGVLRYVYPMSKDYRALSYTLMIMMIISTLSLIIGYILSKTLSEKIVQPISQLKKGAEEIELGNLDQIIEVDSHDEIEDLARTFNRMSANMNSYITKLNDEKERQEVFFNNVTHKLKTPLTSIIGYAELIEKTTIDEEVLEYAFIIEEAGQNQLETIQNILSTRKAMSQKYYAVYEKVNLDELIGDCMEIIHPRIKKQRISVKLSVDTTVFISDRNLITEFLLTLLDNSLIHSQCDTIWISSTYDVEKERMQIWIEDNGIGINKEEVRFITEPFYRGSNGKNRGSGLGLYATKSIVEVLDGTFEIKNRIGGGTAFLIDIPNYDRNLTFK